MNDNSELLAVLDLLVGDKPLTNRVEYKEIAHFSEYKPSSNRLPPDLIRGFNKHLAEPTPEEREAYAIEMAKKEEEFRKLREEEARRGPAFLSDKWYANLPDHVIYARSGRG